MRPWKEVLLATTLALAPIPAHAHGEGGHAADPALHVNPGLEDCSVQFAPELTQSAFHRFVREFGSVSAFKANTSPAAPNGRHFELGIEYARFHVEEHADAWNDTFAHPDAFHELGSDLTLPKIRVRAGWGQRWDMGAFYSANPNANYGWAGLDVRYRALRQEDGRPLSLALRAAYTKTLYVDDMDMHAATFDVTVGRTYRGFVTPYAGLGSDNLYVRETSPVVDLKDEALSVGHVLGGVELRFWHGALSAEIQHGALTSLQTQLTTRF